MKGKAAPEQTVEAFADMVQKGSRYLGPKIAAGKRWLTRIVGILIILFSLPFVFMEGSTAPIIGLLFLAAGLYMGVGNFFAWKKRELLTDGLFVLIGALFAYMGYHNYQKGSASMNWPTTTGTVIASKIETRSRTTGTGPNKRTVQESSPHVEYRYEVDGKSFKTTRITFGQEKGAYQTVNKYPEGKKVTVSYNKEKPEVAVLEPGVDRTIGFVFGGVGIGLMVMGGLSIRRNRRRI